LTCADSWADTTSILRRTHVDALFVDPGIEEPPATLTIARLVEEFPSVAVVVYGPLSPVTVAAVHELSKRGLYRVVLQNFDDDPMRIGVLLDSIRPKQLLPLVFFSIHDEVAKLPPPLGLCLRQIFDAPLTVHSVDEFAKFAGLSRTRLYEIIEEAGLGSPKRLIIAARLLRAYVYLRDPGHAFSHVAQKTGFPDQRVLRTYLRAVFSMSVSQLRQFNDREALVHRLTTWIREGRRAKHLYI
jgi:AraC-like DNA-binding protein